MRGERWSFWLAAKETENRLIACEHQLQIAGPGLSAPLCGHACAFACVERASRLQQSPYLNR
jgi:hypothetical protein